MLYLKINVLRPLRISSLSRHLIIKILLLLSFLAVVLSQNLQHPHQNQDKDRAYQNNQFKTFLSRYLPRQQDLSANRRDRRTVSQGIYRGLEKFLRNTMPNEVVKRSLHANFTQDHNVIVLNRTIDDILHTIQKIEQKVSDIQDTLKPKYQPTYRKQTSVRFVSIDSYSGNIQGKLCSTSDFIVISGLLTSHDSPPYGVYSAAGLYSIASTPDSTFLSLFLDYNASDIVSHRICNRSAASFEGRITFSSHSLSIYRAKVTGIYSSFATMVNGVLSILRSQPVSFNFVVSRFDSL